MNADNLKFRCHALGKIMTEPRSKTEVLSETCKEYLIQQFVKEKYGRQKDIVNRYITKGLMVEEDSITLYSRYKGEYFQKNETRLEDDFITGVPDILEPRLIDAKSAWDIFTFHKNMLKYDKDWWWQIQGYTKLSKQESGILAICLIDTPAMLVEDEKRKLMYKMGAIDDTTGDYYEACQQLEKNLKYEDIDITERVIEIEIKADPEAHKAIENRVMACREYMNTNLFKKLTTIA